MAKMNDNSETTNLEASTAIVRKNVNSAISVVAVEPLHGGMVNRVEKWTTDGKPMAIVAKLSAKSDNQDFYTEYKSLEWYRQNSSFPVPAPYACISGDKFNGTCLLMECAKGHNLSRARISGRGMGHFQRELARILIDLHTHRRDTYGSCLESTGPKRWLDIFAPQIESNFNRSKAQLSRSCCEIVERLLSDLDKWSPEYNQPTLVHGDIWATNIMIDDAEPDRPIITAFLDVNARYTEVEYELAYLRVFSTADEVFFAEYSKAHRLRDGFDDRCLFYWLNTMMLHVALFGSGYVSSCEGIAKRIGLLF
jgi:fructosamine-3-kinase